MTLRKRITVIVLLLVLIVVSAVGIDAWLKRQGPSIPPILIPGAEDIVHEGERGEAPTTQPVDEHSIQGRVVRPSGEPAVGARLLLQGIGDTPPVETLADVGGQFRFDDLELGLYVLEASAEGYGPAQVIGVVPGGAALRLVLHSGRDLRGQLVRRSQVLGEGVVHVGGAGIFPQRAQRVDASGSYRVSGLRPGVLEAIATSPGYSSGFITNIVVDSDGSAQHDFEMLVAPTMSLRLTDRGTGDVIDSGVVTIAPRPIHVLAMSTQIFFGQATVDFLPPGEYWLRVRAPGYLPHDQRFWVTQGGGQVDISLSQGAQVAGVVVDQAGNPLSGVSLRAILDTETGAKFDIKNGIFEAFHGLARPDGTTFWWPSSSFNTTREGQFRIGGLPPGRTIIVATRDGYATGISPPITIQADQQYEDVRVVLERGRSLRGRVENASGRAVAGASVSVAPRALPSWVSGRSLVTDGSGSFLFTGLPSRVRLTVRHPRFGTSQEELDIGPAGLDDHVVRLALDGSIAYRGRILVSPQGSSAGAKIWFLRRDNNLPVCMAIADAHGLFEATQCSALAERVVVFKDGYAPLTGDAPTPGEEREFVLRQGGELDVVSQRYPMAVDVRPEFFLPDEAWPIRPFFVERWKRHNLRLLAPGDYRVTCQAEGFAASSVVTRVNVGERAEAVCPFPHRVATQDVTVVDAQGAPVPFAAAWVEGLSYTPTQMTTDANGTISLEGSPDRWVHVSASHEDWGEGKLSFQLPRDRHETLPLRLTEPIGGTDTAAVIRSLERWGLRVVRDNRALIIDNVQRSTPAESVGFRRGDKLLWIRPADNDRLSIGVRRRSEIVTHELVQGAP